MERFQSLNAQKGVTEITDDHLVKSLVFFALLWFRTYRFLKAGRALLAASCLWLRTIWKGPRRIFLVSPNKHRPLENAVNLVTIAREVFTGMTYFKVHPFVRSVITEMGSEANTLLSFYLLSVPPKEEPCG
ncbi:MAG: hypothetical protein DRI65_01160 [Chloroflexota bacterium]|nr:MAG: hypothetical protein DRI65_01160 [Chloroflexota bacterium]